MKQKQREKCVCIYIGTQLIWNAMYLCGEEKMRFIRRQSNKSRNHGAAEYAYERNRYFYIFVTQKSDTTSLPAIACQFVHISFLSFLFTSLHFSCMPNRIFEAHTIINVLLLSWRLENWYSVCSFSRVLRSAFLLSFVGKCARCVEPLSRSLQSHSHGNRVDCVCLCVCIVRYYCVHVTVNCDCICSNSRLYFWRSTHTHAHNDIALARIYTILFLFLLKYVQKWLFWFVIAVYSDCYCSSSSLFRLLLFCFVLHELCCAILDKRCAK